MILSVASFVIQIRSGAPHAGITVAEPPRYDPRGLYESVGESHISAATDHPVASLSKFGLVRSSAVANDPVFVYGL